MKHAQFANLFFVEVAGGPLPALLRPSFTLILYLLIAHIMLSFECLTILRRQQAVVIFFDSHVRSAIQQFMHLLSWLLVVLVAHEKVLDRGGSSVRLRLSSDYLDCADLQQLRPILVLQFNFRQIRWQAEL